MASAIDLHHLATPFARITSSDPIVLGAPISVEVKVRGIAWTVTGTIVAIGADIVIADDAGRHWAVGAHIADRRAA